MSRANQARISLRTKMAAKDITVGQLARRLNHDAAVISKAVNHGQFPRVVAKIKEALRG